MWPHGNTHTQMSSSSFTGQNKHNKLQKIQYMLHEILTFSSREILLNRLPALLFLTASVSFYQAFFPATYRAFCGSLAQLKQQIIKWDAGKQARGWDCPRHQRWQGMVPSCLSTKGLLVAWKYTGITWVGSSTLTYGIPKAWERCRDALQSSAVQHASSGSRISIWGRLIIMATFLASSSFHTRLLTVLGNVNLYLLPTAFFTYFGLFSLSLFLLLLPSFLNCVTASILKAP